MTLVESPAFCLAGLLIAAVLLIWGLVRLILAPTPTSRSRRYEDDQDWEVDEMMFWMIEDDLANDGE